MDCDKRILMRIRQTLIRNVIYIFCLFTIIACSTTTIHLNKLYLNEEDTSSIQAALEKRGFNVEINTLAYPSDISSTRILYSPFVRDHAAVDKIESTLLNLGYNIQGIDALVTSNHWYTKDTVGLYIVPDGFDPNNETRIENIAFTYQSENCEIFAELNLLKNGTFIYKISSDTKVTGKWSISGYPYILLENDEPYLNFYYEIIKSQRIDKISKVDIIELQPVNNDRIITNCNLLYGIRK